MRRNSILFATVAATVLAGAWAQAAVINVAVTNPGFELNNAGGAAASGAVPIGRQVVEGVTPAPEQQIQGWLDDSPSMWPLHWQLVIADAWTPGVHSGSLAVSLNGQRQGAVKQILPENRPVDAGVYTISFWAGQSYNNTVLVSLLKGANTADGSDIVDAAMVDGLVGAEDWVTHPYSVSFNVAANQGGTLGLRLQAAGANNLNINLDDVAVTYTPVPEPASLGLLALGGLALRRRSR